MPWLCLRTTASGIGQRSDGGSLAVGAARQGDAVIHGEKGHHAIRRDVSSA